MKYNEDLLVELIADGELTHGEIAERIGVSRRTVCLIANGHSRPDLQQQIADTTEGYRQGTIRLASKHMQALMLKQIKVALEGEGETARKAREFLLKNFMQVFADEPAQAVEKRRANLQEKEQIKADIRFERKLEREREDDPSTWTEEDSETENDECGMMNDETSTATATATEEPSLRDKPKRRQAAAVQITATDDAGSAADADSSEVDPFRGEDVFAQSRRIMRQASESALAEY